MVDESGVISTALRLNAFWAKLVPVDLVKVLSVCLDCTHIERIGHVKRLLFFEVRGSSNAVWAVLGAAAADAHLVGQASLPLSHSSLR